MISDPYGPTVTPHPPHPTPIQVPILCQNEEKYTKNGILGTLVVWNHVLLDGGASTLGVSPSYP